MRSDEYRRLHAVCITIAEQCNLPDVRTRWLALAQNCLSLLKELPADFRARKCVEDHSKSRLTGLSPRACPLLRARRKASRFPSGGVGFARIREKTGADVNSVTRVTRQLR